MPDYNYHFDRDDIEAALACLDEYGFCVIRQLIDRDMVAALKDSIDRHLDPEGDLAPASNRYHMSFAEDSEPVWDLVDQPGLHGSSFALSTAQPTSACIAPRPSCARRAKAWAAGTRITGDISRNRSGPMTSSTVIPIPSGCLVLSQRKPSGSKRYRGHREISLSGMGGPRRVRHGTGPKWPVPGGRYPGNPVRRHVRARLRPGPRRPRRPDLLRRAHLACQHGHPRAALLLRHRFPPQSLAHRRAVAPCPLPPPPSPNGFPIASSVLPTVIRVSTGSGGRSSLAEGLLLNV